MATGKQDGTAAVAEGEVIGADVPANPAALALVPDVSDALVLQREPSLVLAEAAKAAAALMSVMNTKKDKVMMGTEQYIEHEDWLTIGHFYGVTSKIEHDEFVEYGEATGWEATAVLIARDGRELGRATAMCLNDEEKWSTRPKFEWCQELKPEYAQEYGEFTRAGKSYARRSMAAPSSALVWEDTNEPHPTIPNKMKSKPKAERFQVGEDKVPTFQLRSMAQTRASAKVHRMVLGFVPVLAGFSATPAEEVEDKTERVPNQPAGSTTTSRPAPPAQQTAPAATQTGTAASAPAAQASGGTKTTKLVTDNQVKRLWAIVASSNFDEDAVVARIKTKYQHTSSHQLTMAEYDELVKWIQDGGDTPAAGGGREPGAEG